MKFRSGTILTAVTLLVAMSATAALAATSYKVLYNFNDANGGGFGPESALVFDSHGNLYGTTTAGGTACQEPGCGVVFELTPNSDGSWSESVLHDFDGSDGSQPHAPVVFDSRGNLYGTAVNGGSFDSGTAFELTPGMNTWTRFVLHSFAGGLDGGQPYAGVTLDNASHVYGTTSAGGVSSYGVVFAMGGPGIPGPTVLHAFTGGNDGEQSFGSLVSDASGNFYGVTWGGGMYQAGTVFEITRNPLSGAWSETVLYDFRGTPSSDGANPYAGMIFDAAGNLYGTTYAGGTSGFGTVFRLTPNHDGTWSETALHSFAGGNDGGNPYGGVTFDRFGNLYGTTNAGGPGRHGTIFRMIPRPSGQWTETVLYGFTGQGDGGWPGAGVVLDSAGNLYGTAVMGGTGGIEHGGVVFEFTP